MTTFTLSSLFTTHIAVLAMGWFAAIGVLAFIPFLLAVHFDNDRLVQITVIGFLAPLLAALLIGICLIVSILFYETRQLFKELS